MGHSSIESMSRILLLFYLTLLTVLLSVSPIFLIGLGFDGSSAYAAAGDQCGEKKKRSRRVPKISESIFKKLGTAQEFIDAKDHVSAEQFLRDVLKSSKKHNGNELGNIHNMLGYIAFLKEDYGAAIYSYEQVLAQCKDITEGLEVTTLYTIAQLSFTAENYQNALDYMETWISKAENPGPEPRIFMGQVYYQMEDYPNALVQIQMGIRIAQDRGTKVKENWWTLLAFLYFEKEDFQNYKETMKILVRDFPKEDYSKRLAKVEEQLRPNSLQATSKVDYIQPNQNTKELLALCATKESQHEKLRCYNSVVGSSSDVSPEVDNRPIDVNVDLNVGRGGFLSNGEYLPIVKVAPVYPRRAKTRGIEGYVVLEFIVTKTGAVRNPFVIEAKPPGIFDRAAINAALKYKYKPKIVNGEPIDVAGVRNRINFDLSD